MPEDLQPDVLPATVETAIARAERFLAMARTGIGKTWGATLEDGTQIFGRVLEADDVDGIRMQTSTGISEFDPQELVSFRALR